jgi:hypothetical protein
LKINHLATLIPSGKRFGLFLQVRVSSSNPFRYRSDKKVFFWSLVQNNFRGWLSQSSLASLNTNIEQQVLLPAFFLFTRK